MFTITLTIATNSSETISTVFYSMFAIAGIYFLIHALPLVALVKRRINTIFPGKSNLVFGS